MSNSFATLWTVAHQAPCQCNSPGKNTAAGCHFLLQEIFPTQGSNPDLPHCRQILCQLSHQGCRLISESYCLISSSACWIPFISNDVFMNNYFWEKSFQKLRKLSTFKKIWWFSPLALSGKAKGAVRHCHFYSVAALSFYIASRFIPVLSVTLPFLFPWTSRL